MLCMLKPASVALQTSDGIEFGTVEITFCGWRPVEPGQSFLSLCALQQPPWCVYAELNMKRQAHAEDDDMLISSRSEGCDHLPIGRAGPALSRLIGEVRWTDCTLCSTPVFSCSAKMAARHTSHIFAFTGLLHELAFTHL